MYVFFHFPAEGFGTEVSLEGSFPTKASTPLPCRQSSETLDPIVVPPLDVGPSCGPADKAYLTWPAYRLEGTTLAPPEFLFFTSVPR